MCISSEEMENNKKSNSNREKRRAIEFLCLDDLTRSIRICFVHVYVLTSIWSMFRCSGKSKNKRTKKQQQQSDIKPNKWQYLCHVFSSSCCCMVNTHIRYITILTFRVGNQRERESDKRSSYRTAPDKLESRKPVRNDVQCTQCEMIGMGPIKWGRQWIGDRRLKESGLGQKRRNIKNELEFKFSSFYFILCIIARDIYIVIQLIHDSWIAFIRVSAIGLRHVRYCGTLALTLTIRR